MRVVRATLTFLCLCLAAGSADAQDTRFDTLSTRPVGPGVIHTYIEAPSMPWTINVLEVDLTNPFLEIESAKSRGLLEGGHERTSSMARRHDFEGHRVVGAVNADFYVGAARPVGMQILDGQVLQGPMRGRPIVGFDVDDRVMMDMIQFQPRLLLDDQEADIHGVNKAREQDELILYNQYKGSYTGANRFGTEVRVRALDPWLANDTLRVVVEEKGAGEAGMAIPIGKAILSGHGTSAAFLNDHVAVGDTMRLYMGIQPGLPALKEAVSGNPFLVLDGRSNVGPRGDGSDRHPRTAVGFSADSTRLFLITVDGRQSTSAGITLPELAHFMTLIGVHTGMNIDGGGSTTMVIRDNVVNSPSDGSGERTVSNALLVVSSAPEGPLSRLFAFPEQVRLFQGHSADFTVYGTDEYYRPIALEEDEVRYEVDPRLGTIDADGHFTAGTERDSGYVVIQYGELTDSAYVVVKTVDRFDLDPNDITTDTTRVINFSVHAYDQDGLEQSVPLNAFEWRTDDPSIGTVDAEGRFRGRASGTVDVIAEHRGITSSATVTVDIREGTSTLSSLETPADWQITGSDVDLANTSLSVSGDVFNEGDGALALDYRFTYQGGLNEVYLDTDLPIEGVPDSILVDARSNGKRHRIYFDVVDALGRTFQTPALNYADNAAAFETQPAAFSRAKAQYQSLTLYYPVRLKRIHISLTGDRQSGETYTGTLYLDNLRVTYPASTVGIEDDLPDSGAVLLLPNYPNPFGTDTVIPYELPTASPARLAVYDLLGRELEVLADGMQPPGRHMAHFDAANLPAGLYFYRLETPTARQTRRMVIVR